MTKYRAGLLGIILVGIVACGLPGRGSASEVVSTPTLITFEESMPEPSATIGDIIVTEPPTSEPVSDVAGRSLIDQADEAEGYMVKVMYVVPSDGADRELDVNGTLAISVGSFQNWLMAQSGGTQIRMDTVGGALDITFVRLSRTDAEIAATGVYVRDEVQADLIATGFDDPHKVYAVYYDGTSTTSCGGGAWPPELIGSNATLYLQGLPGSPYPCNQNPFAASPSDPPGYLEASMIHEIFHTLGAAAGCAPHMVERGHVSESNTDLMYAGPLPWLPDTLDIGRDDYWGHGIEGCVDISKSVYMDPLPADPQVPPGWPQN